VLQTRWHSCLLGWKQSINTQWQEFIYAPKWFTQGYPPFEIDGELWSKRGDFENIASIVRDSTPSSAWKEIKHYIVLRFPMPKGSVCPLRAV